MTLIIALISGVICGACCGFAVKYWMNHQDRIDSERIAFLWRIKKELDNLDAIEKEDLENNKIYIH